jgi:hypothetical protein
MAQLLAILLAIVVALGLTPSGCHFSGSSVKRDNWAKVGVRIQESEANDQVERRRNGLNVQQVGISASAPTVVSLIFRHCLENKKQDFRASARSGLQKLSDHYPVDGEKLKTLPNSQLTFRLIIPQHQGIDRDLRRDLPLQQPVNLIRNWH